MRYNADSAQLLKAAGKVKNHPKIAAIAKEDK
jgi:hypothetical protein